MGSLRTAIFQAYPDRRQGSTVPLSLALNSAAGLLIQGVELDQHQGADEDEGGNGTYKEADGLYCLLALFRVGPVTPQREDPPGNKDRKGGSQLENEGPDAVTGSFLKMSPVIDQPSRGLPKSPLRFMTMIAPVPTRRRGGLLKARGLYR
jgi:hypothetical protein